MRSRTKPHEMDHFFSGDADEDLHILEHCDDSSKGQRRYDLMIDESDAIMISRDQSGAVSKDGYLL